MFRKAVSTIEGVKSDAVSSYQAPFNIVAVLFMFPMKFFLSPRWFHKVNVSLIRVSAFPILLAISSVFSSPLEGSKRERRRRADHLRFLAFRFDAEFTNDKSSSDPRFGME